MPEPIVPDSVFNAFKESYNSRVQPEFATMDKKKYDELSQYSGFKNTLDFTEEGFNELASQSQSTLGNLAKGIYRTGVKVGTEVAKLPFYVAAGVEGIAGGDFDNMFLDAINKADEGLKSLAPVYIPKDTSEGGILNKLGDSAWWATTGADGAGFLISMMVPGQIVKGLKVGEGLADLAKGGAALSELEEVAQAGNNMSKYLKAAFTKTISATTPQKINSGLAVASNTFIEATAEANNTYLNLRDKYKQRGMSDDEASRLASEAASNVFYGNIPILLASNYLVERYLLKGFGADDGLSGANNWMKKTKNMLSTIANEGIQMPTRKSAQYVLNQVGNVGANLLREGFYEEGLQTSLQQYVEDNPEAGFGEAVSGMFNQWWKNLTGLEGDDDSKEFYESAVLGGILGGGMSMVTTDATHRATIDTLQGSPEKQSKKILGIQYSRKKEARTGLIDEVRNAYEMSSVKPDDILDEEKLKNKDEYTQNYIKAIYRTNAAISELKKEGKDNTDAIELLEKDNRLRLAAKLLNAGLDASTARQFYTELTGKNESLSSEQKIEEVNKHQAIFNKFEDISTKINNTHNIRNYPIQGTENIDEFMSYSRSAKLGLTLRASNLEEAIKSLKAKQDALLENNANFVSGIDNDAVISRMNELRAQYPELSETQLADQANNYLNSRKNPDKLSPLDKQVYDEYNKQSKALDEQYKEHIKELNKLYSVDGMNSLYKDFIKDKKVEDDFNNGQLTTDENVNMSLILKKMKEAGNISEDGKLHISASVITDKNGNNYVVRPVLNDKTGKTDFQVMKDGKFYYLAKDGSFSNTGKEFSRLTLAELARFVKGLTEPVFESVDSENYLKVTNEDKYLRILDANRNAIKTMMATYTEFKKQNEELRKVLIKTKGYIEKGNISNAKYYLDKQINRYLEIESKMTNVSTEEFNKLNSELQSVKAEIETYLKVLDEVKKPIDSINANLDNINTQLSIADGQIKALASLYNYSLNSIKPYTGLYATFKNILGEEAYNEVLQGIDNKTHGELMSMLSEYRTKIDEIKTERNNIKNDITELEDKIKVQEEQLESLSKLIDSVENQNDIAQVTSSIKILKQQLEAKKLLDEDYKKLFQVGETISRLVSIQSLIKDLLELRNKYYNIKPQTNTDENIEKNLANKRQSKNPYSLTGNNIDFDVIVDGDDVSLKDKKLSIDQAINEAQKQYYAYLNTLTDESLKQHKLKVVKGSDIINSTQGELYELLQYYRTAFGDKFDSKLFAQGLYSVLIDEKGNTVYHNNVIMSTAFRNPTTVNKMDIKDNQKKEYKTWFDTLYKNPKNVILNITGFSSAGRIVYLYNKDGSRHYTDLNSNGEYMPNMKIGKDGYIDNSGEELKLDIVNRFGKIYAFRNNKSNIYTIEGSQGRPVLVSTKGGSGKVIVLKSKLLGELSNSKNMIDTTLYLINYGLNNGMYGSMINNTKIFSDNTEIGLIDSIIPFGSNTNIMFNTKQEVLVYDGNEYSKDELNKDVEDYLTNDVTSDKLQSFINFLASKEFNIDKKILDRGTNMNIPILNNTKNDISIVEQVPLQYYFDKLTTNIADYRAQLNITYDNNYQQSFKKEDKKNNNSKQEKLNNLAKKYNIDLSASYTLNNIPPGFKSIEELQRLFKIGYNEAKLLSEDIIKINKEYDKPGNLNDVFGNLVNEAPMPQASDFSPIGTLFDDLQPIDMPEVFTDVNSLFGDLQPVVDSIETKKADIERRRQEELNNVGIKQKTAAFLKLRESKTVEDKLNAINIIERNIAEGAILTKEEQREVQKIKDELASEGYEVPTILDIQFHQGMKVIVTSSIPDENLAEGEEIITKVLQPAIFKEYTQEEIDNLEVIVNERTGTKEYYDKNHNRTYSSKPKVGEPQMIQSAQIEVTVGTKKGGISKEQWLKQRQTTADKINAKYKAKLELLNNSKPVVEENKTEVKSIESKIKNKDLFVGVEFDNGNKDGAVPTNVTEINGIEFVQYSNPKTGSLDIILAGTSENDFVGYYRLYENGKPTNKWSSKFENQSRNKDNFKTMITNVQNMLPEGHEYTEKTSISTDGLRVWIQQLSRGYEIQKDNNGKVITNEVAINGDAINNELGIEVNKGDFDNIKVRNKSEFDNVKKALIPYMTQLGLSENNIHWENGTVVIDLPVLIKSNKSKPDIEQQENKSKPARRSFQKNDKGKANLNDLFDANKIKSTDEIIDILINKNVINKKC